MVELLRKDSMKCFLGFKSPHQNGRIVLCFCSESSRSKRYFLTFARSNFEDAKEEEIKAFQR